MAAAVWGAAGAAGIPGSNDFLQNREPAAPARASVRPLRPDAGNPDTTESSGRPVAPPPRGAEATDDRCKAEGRKTTGDLGLLPLGVALFGDGPRPELSIKSTNRDYPLSGYRRMATSLRICNVAGWAGVACRCGLGLPPGSGRRHWEKCRKSRLHMAPGRFRIARPFFSHSSFDMANVVP
jgi:hypothetical protein